MTRMERGISSIAAFLFMLAFFASPAWAQTGSISGTVVDGNDQTPLPGANVVIEGTETGTTTDANGQYELSGLEPDTYTVVASFVGFASMTQEVTVEAGETVTADFALNVNTMQMEEVVAVGYGEQQRRDITGSVSSISTEQIEEVPITDISEALQGNVSGVTSLSTSGRPGEGNIIRVRGRRSLTASNDPLFVVDGVPMEGNIDDLNPKDIESMEVLKDASATAIYGSRGANGVVLVETKRGGNHQTMVSYSGYAGLSEALAVPSVMSGPRFAEMKQASGRTLTSQEQENLENGVSTNWVDMVMDQGYQQSHQLSVRGGNETTRFAISGNYFQERGAIKKQGFTRNTLRLNLDHDVADRFRVGTSMQLSERDQDWGPNPYGGAIATNPLARPYNEDGSLNLRPGADPLIYNPLADLRDEAYIDERQRLRVFGSVFAEIDLLENLNYRVDLAPDIQEYRRGVFQSAQTTARNGTDPYAEKNEQRAYTYTLENVLTYSNEFADVHSLQVTGLYSLQQSTTEWTEIETSQLPYESQLFHNLGSSPQIESYYSNLEEWSLMSFMGRVNYQLMGRYLFTITGRYDGSSRLAEGNKWRLFPSAAVGWNISEEPFMADQGLFSQLKLRASYGMTGNTAISPYQTQGLLNRTPYNFGGSGVFGYEPGTLSNPELQWETSATANIGLDFGLFEDRITGSIEVYQTNTSNLLLERQIPITSGFNSVLQNIGETRNRGYEISVSTVNMSTSNFSWTTDFNVSGNQEEIVHLYGTGEDDVGNQWFIGEPLTVWYDYDMVGIWQEDQADQAAQYGLEPGDIRVRDVNDDGNIDEEDRVILGSNIPDMSIGFRNRIEYHNLDFSFFLFGSFGHTVYNEFKDQDLNGRYNNIDLDFWTPDNPSNTQPEPDGGREFPLYGSSRAYDPGDFLKVRNIQLGYTIPTSFMEDRIGMSSIMRVYANAESPFVFTRIDQNVDPEDYFGEINADAPRTRLFTVGVEITY